MKLKYFLLNFLILVQLLGFASSQNSTSLSSKNFNTLMSYKFPGGNLISNGSFELNYSGFDFEAWSENEGYPTNPVAFGPVNVTDNTIPFAGQKMAAINFIEPALPPPPIPPLLPPPCASVSPISYMVSKPFRLKPNTWYTFFMKYQTKNYLPLSDADKVGPLFQTFRSRDISPQNAATEEECLLPDYTKPPGYILSDNWRTYVHRFKTGAEANFGVVSLLWSAKTSIAASGSTPAVPGASGTFYFDDVYLTEGWVKSEYNQGAPPEAIADNAVQDYLYDTRRPDFISISQKYFNSNTKPVQTVQQDGDRDIVTQMYYDNLGRAEKSTLPIGGLMTQGSMSFQHTYVPNIYADNSNAADILPNYYHPTQTGPKVDWSEFFQGTSPQYPNAYGYAYSQTKYESSALGRVIESSEPGVDWALGSPNSNKISYSSRSTLDPIQPFQAEAGQYFLKETKGADDKLMREYTDKLGRVVRVSTFLDTSTTTGYWINTDYEYDERGNQVKISAPESNGIRLVTDKTYDALNRLVKEHTPATGTTEFIYDDASRVRFSQTANQAQSGTVSFIKYDDLGRVIVTGEISGIGPLNVVSRTTMEANARIAEYPCTNTCLMAGSSVEPSVVKIRNLNQYDTDIGQLSCTGGLGSSTTGNLKDLAFISKTAQGAVVTTSYDFSTAYQETLNKLSGQSVNVNLYALYEPSTKGEVRPPSGSHFDLAVGGVNFTFQAQSVQTTEGAQSNTAFLESEKTKSTNVLGTGDYLTGRLVKTLSCNYELAQVLAESAPREVSKQFRYDKFGNVTRIFETNGYAHSAAEKNKVVQNSYDIQNRLIQKTVCGDIICTPALSHIEKYQYDQLGRINEVRDKQDQVLVKNHYNFLGQLSSQAIGGIFDATTSLNTLLLNSEFHLHGMPKNITVTRMKDQKLIFDETMQYEEGVESRHDGMITDASYTYEGSVQGRQELEYIYRYDNLGRLISTVDFGFGHNPEGAPYSGSKMGYFDDGRIKTMTADEKLGQYQYDDLGRLFSIQGNLVKGRNMNAIHATVNPFAYDLNGNLISDFSKNRTGPALQILYRNDNLPYLFTYRDPGTTVDHQVYMAYDGSGNRVSKEMDVNDVWSSTKSYWSSGREVRENNISSTAQFYDIASVGRVKYSLQTPNGEKDFYLKDHLGSTRETYKFTDGTIRYKTNYLPYGKQSEEYVSSASTTAENVTQKFTTKELDEGIDLNYFGARYYDASIGLWISPDAYRQFANPYAYSPDPINSVDPDGNEIQLTGKYTATAVQQLATGTGIPLYNDNGKLVVAAGPVNVTGTSDVARDVLLSAISSKDVITVNTVRNDPPTFIDAFANNNVDVADIQSFYSKSTMLGASAWVHLLDERAYSLTNNTGYLPAHNHALGLESKVMGATTRLTTPSPRGFNLIYMNGKTQVGSFNFTLDANQTPR